MLRLKHSTLRPTVKDESGAGEEQFLVSEQRLQMGELVLNPQKKTSHDFSCSLLTLMQVRDGNSLICIHQIGFGSLF